MATLGGGNKCPTCNKSVYSNEEIHFEKKHYHTTCFVCSICKTVINSTSKAGSMDGTVSHRLCFEKQMKTSGGKYGGEKVVAGSKLNTQEAAAESSPASKVNIASVFGPSVTRPAAPPPSSPIGGGKPVSLAAAPTVTTPTVASPVTKAPSPFGPTVKQAAGGAVAPVSGGAKPPGPPASAAKPSLWGGMKLAAAPAPPAKAGNTEAKSVSSADGGKAATTGAKSVPFSEQKISVAGSGASGIGGLRSLAQTLSVVKKSSARAIAAVAATPQELPIPDTPPSAQQLAHFKYVFQELDKEKSGYLSDLIGASKKAGFPVDEATANKLLKSWSGRFNFDEFVSAILPVLQLEHRNWQWVNQLPVNPEEDKGPAIPGRWKTVRVFLSSTFVDMHGERDCLINEVFPEINNRVKSHYVRVVPVDLRWGVSSEETNSIQSTCLNEIDHCRTKPNCLPWFVGLRGRRLGWVQTKYQPPTDFESPNKLRWVPPFWETETPQSITSMEVYHAFVAATPPADSIVRSLFVFRQNQFEKDCPENMKWLFDFEYLPKEKEGKLDKEVQHQYAYVPEYQRYSQDYETLQKQIRDSPHPKAIFDYPCNFKEAKLTGQLPWGKKFGVGSVGALDQFRDFITNTLTQSIQQEFPFPGDLTPQERETAKHSSLIEDRAEGFVGRTELLQKMLDYCQGRVSHSGAMVIVGEPGSGKSALMARFCEMYRVLLGNDTKTILISHLVGASEDSESVDKLLRRICEVIRDIATEEHFPDIPRDFESLKKETWEGFVGGATKAGFRVVIILDAVNQLRALNNAHSMTWLPSELPGNCKMVISTLEYENNTYHNLKQLHLALTEERVTPLDSNDRQALVSALLAKYHKKLTCDTKDSFLGNQMEILLNKEQGESPLYLVVACDVLRRFGVYEKLTEYLKSLPGTIPKLFEFVLADLETQHGHALVRIVASLLAVARGGLSESEILAILCTEEVKKELGEAKSNFSQLYGPLRSFFSAGGEGYIRFFHDQLLYVVRARYSLQPNTSATTQTHRFLGHYFREVVLSDLSGKTQATVSHAYGEVIYHLLNAQLISEVRALFLTLDFNYRRVELFSIFALLDDYELYFTVCATADVTVKLLRAALQLATPILSDGPLELAFQLYLRLSKDVPFHPELIKLLDISSREWQQSKATQHKSGLLPVYDTGIVRPGTVLSRLQAANAKIVNVMHYDDGRKLITTQPTGEVMLWDLLSGKPLASFNAHRVLKNALLSPDASLLITLGSDKATEPNVVFKLWNLRKPQPTSESFATTGEENKLKPAQGCAVNESWSEVVTWHKDGTTVFWNLKSDSRAPSCISRNLALNEKFQRKKEADALIKKRALERKNVRAKKQAARGGEAHSSDESQGDEDDGLEVEYDYLVNASSHLFSDGVAVTVSEGSDGTINVWKNTHPEPLASFTELASGMGPLLVRVAGAEEKNGPCLVTATMSAIQAWNFNDPKNPRGESLKIRDIDKLIRHRSFLNQFIMMSRYEVIVFELILPSKKGDLSKIEIKELSRFEIPHEKNSSVSLVDVVLISDEQVCALATDGHLFLHNIGQKNNNSDNTKYTTKQLVWGSDIDIDEERKKEEISKGAYIFPEGAGCVWTGERMLVQWDNGMVTLWHPLTDKINYLLVDTTTSKGLELLPSPDASNNNKSDSKNKNSTVYTRAVMWDGNGLASYIDLTHEGVIANTRDEAAEIRTTTVPLTYVRDVRPMKNRVGEDSVLATKDGEKIVAYDFSNGESCVYHLSGTYGVTTLDAGATDNMNAGLLNDSTYVSSHADGVHLWNLTVLNPHITQKVVSDPVVHRILKHRTKKDLGGLLVFPPSSIYNLGSKLTAAYQFPSGVSKLLKSEEDMTSLVAVGETHAIQWGDAFMNLWDVSAATSLPLKGHTRSINDVYVSEDCKYALSTSDDCSVRVWDLATQQSTVLIGVHSGTPQAKFLPGDGLRVLTWGKREACLWVLKNNAVVNKTLLTPGGSWDEEDFIVSVEVLDGPIVVLVCNGPGCFFFDLKKSNLPEKGYGRFARFFPLPPDPKFKPGARGIGCPRDGSICLHTVKYNEEGALEVDASRLEAHNSQCDIKSVPHSIDFISFGAKDNKVIYWGGRSAEAIWSMTFGYSANSLHLQYDEAHARLRSMFVHMDGGNFALFKPQDIIQADYVNAREALLKPEVKTASQKVADTSMDELDALLASLDVPTQQPVSTNAAQDELDALLAALNAGLEPPPSSAPGLSPQEDVDLDALLKELAAS